MGPFLAAQTPHRAFCIATRSLAPRARLPQSRRPCPPARSFAAHIPGRPLVQPRSGDSRRARAQASSHQRAHPPVDFPLFRPPRRAAATSSGSSGSSGSSAFLAPSASSSCSASGHLQASRRMPSAMSPPASVADPARPVHIVFVGAGAVGGFYASRLHHPEHNVHVSLIGRSNYAALAKNGVQLQTHSFGDYVFHPHAVFPSVTAASLAGGSGGTGGTRPSDTPSPPPGGWDFVVVTTKALPDRVDAAATIAPLVGPSSAIVLIQNGVGVEAPYRARFPQTPIISGVTVVSAEQTRPGVIRQNRWTRLHLGPYTTSAESSSPPPPPSSSSSSPPSPPSSLPSAVGDDSSPLARRGAAALAQLADWWTRLGGIRDIEPLDEVGLQTVRWHKLCINAAFNPSAVLSGGRSNADMAADPELRIHLRAVMDEIWDAAPRILGRPFPSGLARPDKILASTDRNKGARPSMLLDWEAGRPLELEVIVGNPVRIARARGVELPRMQSLYALLRSAQSMREQSTSKGKL